LAIVNINVAAASSMIIWIILDIVYKKCRDHNTNFLSIPGVCSATVAGLVVITPGAGYVQSGYALLMGFIGGPIQLGYQILGIVITISYSAVCTATILLLMHFMIGIRINRHEQVRGLDNVVHGVLDLEQTYQVQQMKLSSTKPKTIVINLPVTSTAE
jgi:ammonia channel protein AmtB